MSQTHTSPWDGQCSITLEQKNVTETEVLFCLIEST